MKGPFAGSPESTPLHGVRRRLASFVGEFELNRGARSVPTHAPRHSSGVSWSASCLALVARATPSLSLVELIELKRAYRLAWHAAEAGTWGRIKEHGLLSTTGLLDLYGIEGEERRQIESERRPNPRVITAAERAPAVIRDQRPLQLGPLELALADSGLTVEDWCRELNRRVFFWLSEKRLSDFLGARWHQAG